MKIEQPEVQWIFQLLSRALFDETVDTVPKENVNLSAALQELRDQAQAAIAFGALPQELAQREDQVISDWQSLTYNTARMSLAYFNVETAIHALLQENHIPYCTLKGSASAAYYPDASLRQMGDIDFIVSEEDIPRTDALLQSNGFLFKQKEHAFHYVYRFRRYVIELHSQITELPENQQHILDLVQDIVPAAAEKTTDLGRFMQPSPLHHGLVMLLHLQRHIYAGHGFGLRHLFDWLVFVNSFADEEFRRIFEEPLRSVGLWRFAQILSLMGATYFHVPYRPWMGEAEPENLANMMELVMNSGDMGCKDEDKNQSVVFLQRAGERGSVFHGLKRKVYVWKPFFKKHPILLPVGFVGYGVNVTYQVCFHHKHLNLKKAKKTADFKNQTYRALQLFETE